MLASTPESRAPESQAPAPDAATAAAPVPDAVVPLVLAWYAEHARDLPWRRPEATPWAVLVSEFMLQQTPVERVREPWRRWLERWPTPAGLAAASPGDAVREWGRLGYPRRALRLHAAARAMVAEHGGEVPADVATLRTLPGVGAYTAAAVASFAYGRREVVLDTNVRRVLHRVALGQATAPAALTRPEVALATAYLPDEPARATRWAVASMELGALVCTARTPRCGDCPVAALCGWRRRGCPAPGGPPPRRQTWTGTDRQCRGALLAVLRAADAPVPGVELDAVWPDPAQRDRALASLLADGLAARTADGRWALPA